MAEHRHPIGPGVRAPDFVLPTTDGRATRFYGSAGGAPLALAFAEGHIAVRPAEALAAGGEAEPLLVFADADGEVRGRFGVDEPATVLLDANLRALGVVDGTGAATAAAVADLLAAEEDVPDLQVRAQAPVLLVPNVLTGAECDRLIGMWEAGGAVETGVEATVEETRAEVRNVKAKRRRDVTLEEPAVVQQLAQRIGMVVMPEIRRAFHYRASRFEGFKLGCYTAETAGFFSAHRDNLSPSTLHRRFALSLNLNEGYEGGEVRFGEFGPLRYRPPRGGALIFSGSLLHEVLPVTRGQRFVLLSFLWGDDVPARGSQAAGSHTAGSRRA